jgi:phosphoserine phosphatase
MDEIFIFPTAEIEQLLLENQIDLVKELKEQGLIVERSFTPDPAKEKSSQERDLTLVIVASGITVVAVSQAISKIIETLARRPILVKETICTPVLDSAGNFTRQINGEILMEWKEEYKLLEPTQPKKENQTLKVNLLKGLQFEILNEQEK